MQDYVFVKIPKSVYAKWNLLSIMISYLLKRNKKDNSGLPRMEWKEGDRLGVIIINQCKMMVAFVRVIEVVKMRSG